MCMFKSIYVCEGKWEGDKRGRDRKSKINSNKENEREKIFQTALLVLPYH